MSLSRGRTSLLAEIRLVKEEINTSLAVLDVLGEKLQLEPQSGKQTNHRLLDQLTAEQCLLEDRRRKLMKLEVSLLKITVDAAETLGFGQPGFPKVKLARAPGHFALKIINKIVSKKHFESTYEPLISDWQEEYFEALQDNEGKVKLFFVNFRHSWALVKACGLSAVVKFAVSAYKQISGT